MTIAQIPAPLTAAAAVLLLAGCGPMTADQSGRSDDASSATLTSFTDMMNAGKDVEMVLNRGDTIDIVARKVSDDEWVRCVVTRDDADSISCDWDNTTKEKPEKFGR